MYYTVQAYSYICIVCPAEKKRIFFTEITLHSEKITCRKEIFFEQDDKKNKQTYDMRDLRTIERDLRLDVQLAIHTR